MRIFIFVIYLLFEFSKLYAQDLTRPETNRVIPPSPTAASLGKYGEYPVSLSTGTPAIDLPLITLNSEKLSLPISLSYHSGSIRPDNVPGWVGLGWSLSAGGVIARTVRDLPDDFDGGWPKGKGFYNDRNTFNNEYNNPNGFTPTYVLENIDKYRDWQPDEFNFNVNGMAGQFYFDHNGQIQIQSQRDLKIEVELSTQDINGSGGHFNKWTITDENGILYVFERKEWSISNNVVGGGSNSAPYVSAWYLSEIRSPISGLIVFTYTVEANKYRLKRNRSTKYSVYRAYSVSTPGAVLPQAIQSYDALSESRDQVIYLQSITFKEGIVEFQTSVRTDPTTYPTPNYTGSDIEERKLDVIIIKDNNNVIKKKWELGYQISDRLELDYIDQVNPVNNDKIRLYQFEYFGPTFAGQSLDQNPYDITGIDFWGFYNGTYSSNKVPQTIVDPANGTTWGTANRNPSTLVAQNHQLKKIIYPTNGFTEFVWEPHRYFGITEEPPVSYEYAVGCSFNCDGVSTWQPNTPQNTTFELTVPRRVYRKIYAHHIVNDALNCSNGSNEITTYLNDYVDLSPGIYSLEDIFGSYLNNYSPPWPAPGPNNTECIESINIVAYYSTVFIPTTYQNAYAGGVRIKEIKNSDGNITITSKRFTYTLKNEPNKSSGQLINKPVFSYDINDKFPFTFYSGIILGSDPVYPTPPGPHIIYSQVQEIEADGAITYHTFTSNDEYPDLRPSDNTGLVDFMPYISKSILRGLPKYTEMYTNDGKKVKETVYEYEVNEKLVSSRIMNNFFVMKYNENVELAWPPTPSGAGGISNYINIPVKYQLLSHWIQKKVETNRLFDQFDPNKYLEVKKEYTYNSNNYQVKKIVEPQSNDLVQITDIKYPIDYTQNGQAYIAGISELQSNHITAPPIETVQSIQNTDGTNKRATAGLITAYGTNSLQPEKKYTLDIQTPTGSFLMSQNSSGVFSINSNYQEKINFKYDNTNIGNLIEQKKADNAITSYTWDYGGIYPIAETINASTNQIAYTSFEADGWGGWTMNPGSAILNYGGLTGKKTITGGVNKTVPAGNYVVGVWSGANTWINGQSQIQTPTKIIGPWRYFEVVLTNVTSINVAGDNIDEVRLYPVGSQMATFTYDPLIGMTSQCDANNRITYYEYDGFGRLKVIRDENKNVLKTFDYQYQKNYNQ